MEAATRVKSWLAQTVELLVDNPEQIAVTVLEGENSLIFEIRVETSDIGKIIGKDGRTARAIRQILYSIGGLLRKRIILEILE